MVRVEFWMKNDEGPHVADVESLSSESIQKAREEIEMLWRGETEDVYNLYDDNDDSFLGEGSYRKLSHCCSCGREVPKCICSF